MTDRRRGQVEGDAAQSLLVLVCTDADEEVVLQWRDEVEQRGGDLERRRRDELLQALGRQGQVGFLIDLMNAPPNVVHDVSQVLAALRRMKPHPNAVLILPNRDHELARSDLAETPWLWIHYNEGDGSDDMQECFDHLCGQRPGQAHIHC